MQYGAVAFQDVFDDGQPKSCASLNTRSSEIDTIKSFGQTREVLSCNTNALITHRQTTTFWRIGPGEADFSTIRTVTDCVREEVADYGQ